MLKSLLPLFFAISCASAPPAALPAFPSAKVSARHTVKTSDGLTLRAWQLNASTAKQRGTLVVVHGLKDYSERYLPLAHAAAARGYQVFGVDLRGHGRSEGDAAYVEDFALLVEDLHQAMLVFHKAGGKGPWFIFGHSMGGGLVARYAQKYPKDLDGFILSAPALAPTPDVGDFLIGATKTLSVIAPHLQVLDLPDANFSRDPKVVASMATDPLIHDEKIPARTAAELLANMNDVHENLDKLMAPSLLLHGSADVVTNPEGSKKFQHAVRKVPGSTINVYPGLFHDLLHEPEHDKVQADILSWMDAHS